MNKKIIGLLSATIVFVMLQTSARADFNPAQFAQNFNTFNGNYHPGFIAQGTGPAINVIDVSARGFDLNLSGYASDRAGMVDPSRPWDIGMFRTLMGGTGYYFGNDLYFSSFSLTSTLPQNQEFRGSLSYDNGLTRLSDGTPVTIGLAYLYTKYATGAYNNWNDALMAELYEAMRFLAGRGSSETTWFSNGVLSSMITETALPGLWMTSYNLNTEYPAWVDNNYAIYAMNLEQSQLVFDANGNASTVWTSAGDVLYLVRRDGGGTDPGTEPGTVPEPGTLLAWSIIGLGMFGAARLRKKRRV